MRNYLIDKNTHRTWIDSRIGVHWGEDVGGFITIDDNGIPAAAAILYGWEGKICYIHAIVDKPIALRYGVSELALEFAFNKCGVEKVLATIDSANKRSMNFAEKMGFSLLYQIDDVYDKGRHQLVYQLKKADCQLITQFKEVS